MIDFENKLRYDIFDLRKLMRLLRGPQGCPWDREQTHKSIRRNLLEEAYELAGAIDEEDAANMLEELGDILLQALFHADIAEDENLFTFDDVIDATCKKLLRRHPHVFNLPQGKPSGITAKNGEESIGVWEAAKRAEKQHETTADSMSSVTRAIPALWRAQKVQEKAARVGFDWPDCKGALQALRSELEELAEAIEAGGVDCGNQPGNIEEELGDLLFSVVNVARFYQTDPEDALSASADKFISRFRYMEETAARQGRTLGSMNLEQMEALYQEAKRTQHKN